MYCVSNLFLDKCLSSYFGFSCSGIMIPIPQYPLYSATLDLLGGHKIGYYLDEQSIWGMNVQELERSLAEAKANGVNVVALVLINPGNPTGQVLSGEEVKDIVSFCARHDIVLLSDEVYQENVYREEDQFFSARRAADELGLIEVRVLATNLIYHIRSISGKQINFLYAYI